MYLFDIEMEVLYFVILGVMWPIKVVVERCQSKHTAEKRTPLRPDSVCKKNILKNTKNGILCVNSQNLTDMWTRDTFFASMDNISLRKRMMRQLVKYQRKDGLIPVYIGQGGVFGKLFEDKDVTNAYYKDVKTGSEPTDSCFQFIIMAHAEYPKECKLAWNYMQKYIASGLIWEEGLGTWQDTIKHKGHVTYTNLLYYKATLLLFPKRAAYIKKRIIGTLWNGKYFMSSTTNKSFGQVANALSVLYEVAPSVETIFSTHATHFKSPTAPPNLKIEDDKSSAAFGFSDIYLPCYPFGTADYHNKWSLSWVNLLFMKAKLKQNKEINLSYYSELIQKYGTLHDSYDENGPIKRLLYKSQPGGSASCGLFVDIYNHTTV